MNYFLFFPDYDLSGVVSQNVKNGQLVKYHLDTSFFGWLKDDFMFKLGLEGWELCGVSRGDGDETLFFKREITRFTKSPEEARLSSDY